ncbi:nucleotidyltransferase substrate binding protein, HI0074 family [Marinomonas polaris DSM 16579]|uniref:Nucleotidyltransferase substrate binding protein, HI0074 family n=1 Tax=Marinomonas polaris DSM 16579 TaxID=1122206 RepID=A0A1M4V4H7_9GAMM|nr:nucleotidyltransferase substrate binding protein [Marinomonas polaris]SHE63829.1 nucleotidyltransferase substrate binding protein, HI0074 family [Marinomonas polaris DSM 16579]
MTEEHLPTERWKQRLQNYSVVLQHLNEAVEAYDEKSPNIIKEGVLQRFEFTHELAWKVLKDYLEYEGHQNITGSRTATRLAFNLGLIQDGQIWIDMIESRNKTVHAYDASILETEFSKVRESYNACFIQLKEKLSTL